MAPVPGDSSKHQFGTSMPQGGHPPHHSITSSAATSRPGRHVEAERPSRLQIDNKLELGGLRYRQVSGRFPLEDAANIDPDLAKRIGHVCSIAHQSASFGVVAIGIGGGNPVSCRQNGKLHASAVKEKVGGDEQRFGIALRTCIFNPKASAAFCTSRTVVSALTTLPGDHRAH